MQASTLALTGLADCLGQPSPPGNPQHDLRPAQSPILLVNARHDPATAYSWAQHVARQLGPKAALLTYGGWGHVIYNRTPCVKAVVDKYLIDGSVPAAGAECPAVPPVPFGVGGAVSAGAVAKSAPTGQRPDPHWGYR